MRQALLVAVLVMAGCVTRTVYETSDAGDETFTEKCEKTKDGPIAEHDFGTTDPTVLARVVAYETSAPGLGGLDGGDITGQAPPVNFQGSVAFVLCAPGSTVTFEVLP